MYSVYMHAVVLVGYCSFSIVFHCMSPCFINEAQAAWVCAGLPVFLMRWFPQQPCAEALSDGCYGQLLYAHLMTITKLQAQDAISHVLYEWVLSLHGGVTRWLSQIQLH